MNLSGKLAVAAVLVGCLACDGRGPVDPAFVPVGKIEGQWDGKAWEGRFFGLLLGDTLHVIGHRPDPKFYYDEWVEAEIRLPREGTFPIDEKSGRLLQIVGGDAGSFDAAGGSVVITLFDLSTGRVAGEIRLTGGKNPAKVFEGRFDGPIYTNVKDIPDFERK